MRPGVSRKIALILVIALLLSLSGLAEPFADISEQADPCDVEYSLEEEDALSVGAELPEEADGADLPEEAGGAEPMPPEIGDAIGELEDLPQEIFAQDLQPAPETAEAEGADAEGAGEAPNPENATKLGVPVELWLGVKQTYAIQTKELGGNPSFSSSNAEVAAVSSKGVITAMNTGTATVSCYSNGQKKTDCQVTVVAAPSKVSFNPAKVTIGVKESIKLQPTIPAGSMATYTWSSKSKKIATVAKDGTIKGVKAGKTTITVKTQNGKTAKLTVTVKKAPSKVTLKTTELSLLPGKSRALKATLPAKTASYSLKWESSDASIAAVSDKGVVTAITPGKARITVTTFNGKTASCRVSVKSTGADVEALSWSEFASASSVLSKLNNGKIGMASAGSPYATARLIVKVNGKIPDLSQFDVEAIYRDKEDHYLIQLFNDSEAEACAKYLTGFPEVVYAEPDELLDCSDGASDLEASYYSWGVKATHSDAYAADLARRGKTGRIVVGVIDSGVEYDHPLLSGRIYKGYDIIDDDSYAQDDHGHGTHVSGIIVQCTPGLKVCVMPLRVFDKSGRASNVIIGNAVQRAIEEGVDVINMSLGGGTSSYLDEKVNKAVSKGIVVVVAAGNDNKRTDNVSPAHNQKCITVAAVDEDIDRAYFSNYGSAVDIAAPGVSVKSSYPGRRYASMSGTSMATPHVAAAAAMLLCDNSGLSPSSVETKLRNAARDRGASGWDQYYGAGFMDMRAFVQGNSPTPAPTTAPTLPPRRDIPDRTRNALIGNWRMYEVEKSKSKAIQFGFAIQSIDDYGNVTLDWGGSGRITGTWNEDKQSLKVFENQEYVLEDGVLGGGNQAFSGVAFKNGDNRQGGESVLGKWRMSERRKNKFDDHIFFDVKVLSVGTDGKAKIRWANDTIEGKWNSKTQTLTVYKDQVYLLRNGVLGGASVNYSGVATRYKQDIPQKTRDALVGRWSMYEVEKSKNKAIQFGFAIQSIDEYGNVTLDWGGSGRIIGTWNEEKQSLLVFKNQEYLLEDGVLGGGNQAFSGVAFKNGDNRQGDDSIVGRWRMGERRKNSFDDHIYYDIEVLSVGKNGKVKVKWAKNTVVGKWNSKTRTLTVYKDQVYLLRNGVLGGASANYSGVAIKW